MFSLPFQGIVTISNVLNVVTDKFTRVALNSIEGKVQKKTNYIFLYQFLLSRKATPPTELVYMTASTAIQLGHTSRAPKQT